MGADETKKDWTKVKGRMSYPFYTAPTGYKIKFITDLDGLDLTLEDKVRSYTDIDHDDDVLSPGLISNSHPSIVAKYVVVGDTNGNEAGTRTGVTTTTKPMNIVIWKCR